MYPLSDCWTSTWMIKLKTISYYIRYNKNEGNFTIHAGVIQSVDIVNNKLILIYVIQYPGLFYS